MLKCFLAHIEGAGAGLYMPKKMVENADGNIDVESMEGEDTTFRVCFPH